MNLSFGIRLEQAQKLIMTPELRQAIKILQFSSLELVDFVNQMIEENPMIEINEEENIVTQEKKEKETEIDWEYLYNELAEAPERKEPREVKPEIVFEDFVTRSLTLNDHLLTQLGYLDLAEKERDFAEYLLGNINPSGYLTVSLQQAAEDMGCTEKEAERALSIIQNFDPPGVGARDLKECILLQLQRKDLAEQDLCDLVENHLENIATGKLNRVAQAMNISVTKVQELADTIKTLNPKPGASFGGTNDVRYIVPDVLVERIGDDYVIIINDNNVPRLTINKTYSSILNKTSKTDDSTRDFVEGKLNQAMWLIRSIEQRRTTIYKVTNALLKKQRGFFDRGIKFLKPLTLKQVAEMVDVHESTVSRATANKYIQTPHGIFEFKFFFNPGLSTNEGGSTSSESIKRRLKEMVGKEEPSKPYSDQELSNMFKKDGVSIARRTISKYREEMGIPNACARKRF